MAGRWRFLIVWPVPSVCAPLFKLLSQANFLPAMVSELRAQSSAQSSRAQSSQSGSIPMKGWMCLQVLRTQTGRSGRRQAH